MAEGHQPRIKLVLGDITKLDVDAVVTAANEGLYGGGGVDGAVHAAAGSGLLAACRPLAPCPAGEARLTPGFQLRAQHVIHAVGPIYSDGRSGEAEALRGAYLSSLELAATSGSRSVAFPCISTGAYGFPKQAACEIALGAVIDWLRAHEAPRSVTFCCFDGDDHTRYQQRLDELGVELG